ncbi:MAG TPA: DUF2461 domain-containing protein [Fimbriimonadaceae bacterium]|nr:DUF2461 domain-containing protein [Fimbriimonadaceae bacterium]HRJ97519.1 DUF2461 domain-containing protein [Fimbriimonadaceae bacterium]
MSWFTNDTMAFFRELEQNNDKVWFEANKKRYEGSVKRPMEEFAAEMIGRMQALDPAIDTTPRQAVFRIYRDTRFSKDKTPYKTNAGLAISRGGKHNPSTPGLYFHVDGKEVAVASGCYAPDTAQVLAIRKAIAANLDEFGKLIGDKGFVDKFGEVRGERNKVLPPEFKEVAKIQPLIANKQFYYWATLDSKALVADDLPDRVMGYLATAAPLNLFLMKALGI